MSIFICENPECKEHYVMGTDKEWMDFKSKLRLDNKISSFFIVSKDCPNAVPDEYRRVGETKNLIAYTISGELWL